MDEPPQSVQPNVSSTSATELSHINEEMYKKNFELAEKNKTLSLLRKIDEIILSSVTDVKQIAQQVVDVTVKDAEFKAVVLYLLNQQDQSLKILAVSENVISQKITYLQDISLTAVANSIVSCVREKKMQIAHGFSSLTDTSNLEKEGSVLNEKNEINSSLVYPLIIRGESVGALVISLGESEDTLSPALRELIDRLVLVIGIAVDNALLYQHIQEANERLKTLDVLKDEFVSVASHELRTPMTAIRSYLWMALSGQGGPLSDKQKFYVQRSYNSVDRLLKLVNDMLNVSRIESGRITLEVQPVYLVPLTQEVIDEVLPRTEELGLKIVLDSSNIPSPVLADPDKIKEVLFNLIGNSFKFTPSGGTITVSFIAKDNEVYTKVSDTGIGIEPDNISKLFQKFGILPGSYTINQSAMGTGLGLYICKSIIELHGGKISVASEGKGKGTSFTFSLPEYTQERLEKFHMRYRDGTEHVGLEHTQV